MPAKLIIESVGKFWLEPGGKLHQLPGGADHNEWAREYVRKVAGREPTRHDWPADDLLSRGWLRGYALDGEVFIEDKIKQPVTQAQRRAIQKITDFGNAYYHNGDLIV